MKTIRTHLIDASVLVKLLVKEDHSDKIKKYFNDHSVFFTTSICFAETLGVLKSKINRKEISKEEYLCASEELMAYIRGDNIQIDDLTITDASNFNLAESFVKKYKIDLADSYSLFIF